MKLKAALVALFVAGLGTSVAIAGPHVGAKKKPKVTMCHLTGKKKLVTIKVARSAVKAHLRRGDKMGACPKPKKTKTVTVTVTSPGTTVTVTQPCTTTTSTTTSTTTPTTTSTSSTSTTSSTTSTSTSTSTSTAAS
jgi:hypothetical protein